MYASGIDSVVDGLEPPRKRRPLDDNTGVSTGDNIYYYKVTNYLCNKLCLPSIKFFGIIPL